MLADKLKELLKESDDIVKESESIVKEVEVKAKRVAELTAKMIRINLEIELLRGTDRKE
ncbi:hypothetical protein ES704_01975 [subsurface metagenome]|jgi:hypothetical protein